MSDEIKPVGAVIYTDGSARPNPGFFGSGLHGYTFVYPNEKNKITRMGAWIPTDKGYMLQRDFEKGGAQQICVVKYIDAFVSSDYEGTNNLAEINAITLFFENFKDIVDSITKLSILADSQYVLNGLEKWVSGWMKNGWITGKGLPVNNQEAWEVSYGHIEAFRERGQVELIWVRGHNDDLGNVKADYMAKTGTGHSTAGIVKTMARALDPLRYHKVDIETHPMLGLKRIYFNTDGELNTPGVYYQTGAPEITGKRTPEATFSVVRLDKPDEIIESVIGAYNYIPSDFNSIAYLKLDRIRKVDVYPYLRLYGRLCLIPDKRNKNLNFFDEKPVTLEIRPGELPLRTINVLTHLEEMLEAFRSEYLIKGTMGEDHKNYQVHEVTDHFYDTATKKVGKAEVEIKLLKKKFGVGVKSTSVPVVEEIHGEEKEFSLPLVFMDDIPGRNTMKHLETLHPRVFLITWRESEHLLRYSTVVQTSDALGIWSNYFANQLLI